MEFEFEKPEKKGYTIYSKSGCANCVKVKLLIKEKHLLCKVVDCDEYILEDKESFLSFIKQEIFKGVMEKETTLFFPIVFNEGKYIGGYNETREQIDKFLQEAFDGF